MWKVFEDDRMRSLLLVNLAAIMERADEALLPSVYKELSTTLHASPLQLGSLTFVRSLTQCFFFPVAAYLAVHHNRASVIALGAILWAAATFLVGISTTFMEVAFSRAFNGVGLAMVVPAIQSMIADFTEDRTRGAAFGWLSMTSGIGSILGGAVALLLAEHATVLGVAGWRMAFHLVAVISVVVAWLVYRHAVDPRMSTLENRTEVKGAILAWTGLKEMLKEARVVIGIRTFQIIVAQGVAGSFAWGALAFAPLWLELVGYSHKMTAVLLGLWTVATSFGSLFGGNLGDYLSTRLPNTGRIILSQISSGVAVPLSGLLLLGVPDDPSSWFKHSVVMTVMGFMITWNAAATNNPIFAEIVPEKARTSIYALDRSFESVLAAFAPPLVGYLAETFFGYVAPPENAGLGQELAADRRNARSLARALFVCIAVPLSICCAIYSLVYCTYPRDRERARVQSRLRQHPDDCCVGLVKLKTMTYEDDARSLAEEVNPLQISRKTTDKGDEDEGDEEEKRPADETVEMLTREEA